MEGMSQLSSFAYIMMQDRLSTGGSFILCDGNARGFPISYASPGFVSLFGYPASECVGVKCGLLVAGPSIVAEDRGLLQTAKTHGMAPASVASGIGLMTQYTGEECRLIMRAPSEKVSFSLVLNRHKRGELFVCELTMLLHCHPVLGWSYFVGLQRDISHDITVQQLLMAATSKHTYLQLVKEREGKVVEHVQALGMTTDNAVHYLHEKACESWRTLMVSSLPDTKKLSELPDTLCSTTAADSVESESTATGSTSKGSANSLLPVLLGCWTGQVSPQLGGYSQALHFLSNGVVRVTVYNKTAVGTYAVDIGNEPKQLILKLPGHVANAPPPPPLTCILRIVDSDTMHLCLPGPSLETPSEFAGSGYCVMSRVQLPDIPEREEEVGVNDVSGWDKQTSYNSTALPSSEDVPRGSDGGCSSWGSKELSSTAVGKGDGAKLMAAAVAGAALTALLIRLYRR